VELRTGDAMDCLLGARLSREYFDLIDIDGFGSGAPHNAEALGALKVGGLLYLCCTDARTGAGRNAPPQALRAFGGLAASTPCSNELIARLVIADAARQAAARGLQLVPVFAFYHRPSSCARVMLRLAATGRKSPQVTSRVQPTRIVMLLRVNRSSTFRKGPGS
jgi:tRNA (guanine26-N2/guanine27-N2)-dimethyltransferase